MSSSHKQEYLREKPTERPKMDIITRVQAQKGVAANIVLIQGSNDVALTILNSAVQRLNAVINIISPDLGTTFGPLYTFKFVINDEVIAEKQYPTNQLARKELPDIALVNLQKKCFTIIRKVPPRNIPQIELASASSSKIKSQEEKSVKLEGIGAKMMLQMGWSGGGLGAKEQGTTELIEPHLQIQRRGFGTKNIVQEVTKVLKDYAASKDINAIAFSKGFSQEERVTIHQIARRLNLKSKSYGKGENRVLVVRSKVEVWDLIGLLLQNGGENEQYKLLIPSAFAE